MSKKPAPAPAPAPAAAAPATAPAPTDGTAPPAQASPTTPPAPKWPKGHELARAIAGAVARKKLTPVQLYSLLLFALDEKPEIGLNLTLANGCDLRDPSFSMDAVVGA